MLMKILFIIECFILKNRNAKLQTVRNNKQTRNNHINIEVFLSKYMQ